MPVFEGTSLLAASKGGGNLLQRPTNIINDQSFYSEFNFVKRLDQMQKIECRNFMTFVGHGNKTFKIDTPHFLWKCFKCFSF